MQARVLAATLVAVVLAGPALAVGAGVAGAHGNHLSVSPQATNGTVIVEEVFLSRPGHVVLRADADGSPGRIVGHRSLTPGRHAGVSVTADPGFWRDQSAPVRLWVVLHADDGDGQFDPDDDAMLRAAGGPPRLGGVVGNRSNPAAVVAGGVTAPDGTVGVSRVHLAEAGYVVAHAVADDGLGEPVGRTRLDAGVHRNVRIELDPAFVRRQDDRFPLRVVVYRAGDDPFSPTPDRRVTVGDRPVGSDLLVRKQPSTVGVVTATPGETGTSDDSGTTRNASSSGGAGFGVSLAVAAVAVLAGLGVGRCKTGRD
jgi:hypothetical protein